MIRLSARHLLNGGEKAKRKGEPMASLVTQALPGNADRSLKIIAKSLFKELKANGFDTRHIVSLSSELIGLVTTELRSSQDSTAAQ